MTTTPLHRKPQKIIDEIIRKCKGKKCIFRGENREYNKKGETPVSSAIYRKLHKLGVKNPSVLSIEENVVESARQHFPINTSNIEILTEIQHYGGTTALIDFTYNLHVALYFASAGDENVNGQLFICDTENLEEKIDVKYDQDNESENIKDIFIKPNSKNTRVISQHSVFVRSSMGYLADNGAYKTEIIFSKEKEHIKYYLNRYFGIKQQTIYNDIHGLIHLLKYSSSEEKEFYEGLAAYQSTDYVKAIDYYGKAIEINSQYADAYNNRGIAKSALGKYKEALLDFDKAIDINPQLATAYDNRGTAKFRLLKYAEAILDFDKAIEINPRYANAYNSRGNAKFDLQRYSEAILDFDKAIEIYPQFADAYANIGIAKLTLGNLQGAILDFDKAIEINPENTIAYGNRGNAKFALDDKKGAILDFDKVIKINPQDADAYYARGGAIYNSGDIEKAKKDWLQAKKLAKKQNLSDLIVLIDKALKKT